MASPPAFEIDERALYEVTIATDKGDIVLELDPALAPTTVNNVESIAVAPTVGMARVVSAAPELALALGYDVDAALEARDGGEE